MKLHSFVCEILAAIAASERMDDAPILVLVPDRETAHRLHRLFEDCEDPRGFSSLHGPRYDVNGAHIRVATTRIGTGCLVLGRRYRAVVVHPNAEGALAAEARTRVAPKKRSEAEIEADEEKLADAYNRARLEGGAE